MPGPGLPTFGFGKIAEATAGLATVVEEPSYLVPTTGPGFTACPRYFAAATWSSGPPSLPEPVKGHA